MPKTRLTAAFLLSGLLALGACDAAGEHQNADSVQPDSAQQPVTGPEAASEGNRISGSPPPTGTVNPDPPDSNPSPSTPNDPSTSGGQVTGDSAAKQP
jgi:hypothetical protein